MLKYQVAVLLVVCTFSACNSRQDKQALVPALLTSQSPQDRVLIEKAIGTLMSSRPVKLAAHVFVNKSTVIIGPKQSTDNHGNLLNGRETRPVDTFTLLVKDELCYLRHNQSGNTQLVQSIKCKAKS